nr:TIGR02679 domain-containing protein [Streptomyces turgidiscabies]
MSLRPFRRRSPGDPRPAPRPAGDRPAERADGNTCREQVLKSAHLSRLAEQRWFVVWLERIAADGTLTRPVRRGDTPLLDAAVRVWKDSPVTGTAFPAPRSTFPLTRTGSPQARPARFRCRYSRVGHGRHQGPRSRRPARTARPARPRPSHRRRRFGRTARAGRAGRALWESAGATAANLARTSSASPGQPRSRRPGDSPRVPPSSRWVKAQPVHAVRPWPSGPR